MKSFIRLMMSVLAAGLVLVLNAKTARAQDPVQVDPRHYKVMLESNEVRVLQITYGPHEKSVMHEHPASVVVCLTDQDVKFTFPDGKTEERHMKAGQSELHAAGKHLPENLSDKPLEAVLVELKTQPATAQ